MFGKDAHNQEKNLRSNTAHETVIGESVKVDGDFISDGDVLVKGVVNGSIKTKGNLRIEEKSKIKAHVEALNAIIDGRVNGNITIGDNLEIGSEAIVEGDIIAKVLSIAPGARINGHCSVSADKEKESHESEVRNTNPRVMPSKLRNLA